MAIFPIYDRKLGIEYNYYLLLQTNICLTALARLERAQCQFQACKQWFVLKRVLKRPGI